MTSTANQTSDKKTPESLQDDANDTDSSSGVKKPIPVSNQVLFEIDTDIMLEVSWDKDTETVSFVAEMPTNAYLALAFGSKLENCDMLVF